MLYKETDPIVTSKKLGAHELQEDEKTSNSSLDQNSIVEKLGNLFETLNNDIENSDFNITILFRIDWTAIYLKTNIDNILQENNVPQILLYLLTSTSTAVVELTLRITIFLCKNSMFLLSFILGNFSQFVQLIRAPRLFPLVCQLIEGFCLHFSDAADKMEKDANIVQTLCEMSLTMPPPFVSVACYVLTTLISSMHPEEFEDFQEIINKPIFIICKLIGEPETIIESAVLISAILNLLSAILSIYSGTLTDLLPENFISRLVEITNIWQSIDDEGKVFSDVLKAWNLIIFKFSEEFNSLGLAEAIIPPLVGTISEDNCPRGRVLLTLGNIAAVDTSKDLVANSGIIEAGWEIYESFTSDEKEIYIFTFMNCIQVSPTVVIANVLFQNILNEAFDLFNGVKSSSYQLLFIRTMNKLLKMDDSVTSFIDRDDALTVFESAANSNDVEVSEAANVIIKDYFDEED